MAEAPISPDARISTTKAPEAAKAKKKAGKKEVKGYYYHAAEYQRKAQQERTRVQRFFSSIAEPFILHVRAGRLRIESWRKKGGMGGSTVLSNEYTKKALEGTLSQTDIQQFRAKSQAHEVMQRSHISDEQALRATNVLSDIFNKRGASVSSEEMNQYIRDSGLSSGELARLQQIARENGDGYLTVGETKDRFADEVIFGSLTSKQQEQARILARSAWISTGATILNIAKYPVIIAALGSANPLGVAIAGGLLSAGGRASRLMVEQETFDISRSKGIEVSGKTHGLLGKVFSVDWEADPSTRRVQILRAAAVGGLMSFAARHFAPAITEAWQHPGESIQHVGSSVGQGFDNLADKITHPGGVAPVPFHETAAQQLAEAHVGAGNINEHLQSFQTDKVHVSFLPDTQHHDWQQLHSFIGKSGGHNTIELKYNGVDDGLPHEQHYIDLMMNDTAGGHHVFIQNDAVLAVNGPDADKLIKVYGLVHGYVQQVGEIHSVNLAHQLGLDQGKIDNFATLTAKAHGGLWHGTQDASDLQRIMFNRGIYDDGAHGQGLYGVRIGGGYFDKSGGFHIGASNHYYDSHILNNQVIKQYPVSPTGHVEPEEFHSAVAPVLSTFDTWEDNAILWLAQHGFGNGIIAPVDTVTDIGLWDTDTLTALGRGYIGIPLTASVYAATGIIGYRLARERMTKKPTVGNHIARGVSMATLALLLPGAAVSAAVGNVIGRVRNRMQRNQTEKAPTPTVTSGQIAQQPAPVPSETVQSAAQEAPNEQGVNPITPAPPPPPTTVPDQTQQTAPVTPETTPVPATPETLPAQGAIGNQPTPTAPPAPPVGEAVESAVPAETTEATLGSVPPPAEDEVPTVPVLTPEALQQTPGIQTSETGEQTSAVNQPQTLIPETEAVPETLPIVEQPTSASQSGVPETEIIPEPAPAQTASTTPVVAENLEQTTQNASLPGATIEEEREKEASQQPTPTPPEEPTQ